MGRPVYHAQAQDRRHAPDTSLYMSIEGDKPKKTFELVLLREEPVSREQRMLRAKLGVKLSEPQARLFAFACRRRGASLADAKAVTGHSGPEARKVLDAIAVQGTLGAVGRYTPIRPCRAHQWQPRRCTAWSVDE